MQKNHLHKLITILDQFRADYPEMPVQMAMVFLFVATHEDCSMKEIERALDIFQASVSRNVAALDETHRSGNPGAMLIEAYPDPLHAKRRLVRLRPKGRRVADTVGQLME